MELIKDFHFNTSLVAKYKSHSQKVRMMSEQWVSENIFCPCCGNLHISHQRNNNPVGDFICDKCREEFELKSIERHFGRKIVDGAYTTMIERITSRNNPHLFMLTYSEELMVKDFMFVPKFFFVPGIIEKRKPLAKTARRANWVGCNILINDVPKQGRIEVIGNRIVHNPEDIVEQYRLALGLRKNNIESRGWLFDVLNCVNRMEGEVFKLSDMYKFVPMLKERHLSNNNVEAKIRQQLQFLRDKGFIEFLGRGIYKKRI